MLYTGLECFSPSKFESNKIFGCELKLPPSSSITLKCSVSSSSCLQFLILVKEGNKKKKSEKEIVGVNGENMFLGLAWRGFKGFFERLHRKGVF